MRTLLTSILILWVSITLVGCGSDANTAPVPPSNKDYLQELGDALKNLPPDIKKAPGKMSELDAIEPLIPSAGTAIRTGSIIYVWGTSYQAGSISILAYEKSAPEAGGFVLLQDGTVKKLTAQEFATTSKAKK